MSEELILSVERGIWIDEAWLQKAGLGSRLQIVVQAREIRILAAPANIEQQKNSEDGWDVFLTLGDNAQPGILPNAAVEHDRYLYTTTE